MDLPKFNETFLPILDILSDGKIIAGRKLLELVEKKYYSDFPPELLNQTTKSGERLIENRIAWGKSYLKKAVWFITHNEGRFKSRKKERLPAVNH